MVLDQLIEIHESAKRRPIVRGRQRVKVTEN
jgi:hypothetical protein